MKIFGFLLMISLASCTTPTGNMDANNITGTWNGTTVVAGTPSYQAVFTDANGTVVGKNFICAAGFTNCVAKVSFSGTRQGTDLSLTVTDIDASDGTSAPDGATGTVAGNKLILTSTTFGLSLGYTKKQ
jgi:hypothetical protein